MRDVGELESGVLVIKRDHGIAAMAEVVDSGAVCDDNVELAIVVAVDQADAPAYRFDDVLLVRGGNMRNREATFTRDIFKLRQLCPERGGYQRKEKKTFPNHDEVYSL